MEMEITRINQDVLNPSNYTAHFELAYKSVLCS